MRVLASLRSFTLLPALMLLALGACRNDRPETPSAGSPSTTAPRDSVVAGRAHDTLAPPGPGPGPGSAAVHAPSWSNDEMIGQVEGFLATIERSDRQAFMEKLARRSMAGLQAYHATEEVWGIANDAFGDIKGRKISVVGGSNDSVAMLLAGERTVEGEVTDDPVILSLLREDGSWKVMYPGLLYPNNHLKK